MKDTKLRKFRDTKQACVYKVSIFQSIPKPLDTGICSIASMPLIQNHSKDPVSKDPGVVISSTGLQSVTNFVVGQTLLQRTGLCQKTRVRKSYWERAMICSGDGRHKQEIGTFVLPDRTSYKMLVLQTKLSGLEQVILNVEQEGDKLESAYCSCRGFFLGSSEPTIIPHFTRGWRLAGLAEGAISIFTVTYALQSYTDLKPYWELAGCGSVTEHMVSKA